MKIYLLSPVAQTVFTSDFIDQLKPFGEIIIDKDNKPLSQIKDITTNEEKIIAVDPDFCNWKLDKADLESIPNIKAICIQSTSFGWVNLDYCQSKNIVITNVPGYSSQSVAEWAVMMAMTLARRLPMIIKSGWKEDMAFTGLELNGKTAGIIGLGRIGSKMAQLCQGLGMQVQYWSRHSTNSAYTKVDLPAIFSTSDIILNALVENDETKKLITDNMLKTMKKTAIMSSIYAVHNLYNHQLVLDMVKNDHLFGYGFEGHAGKFNNFEGNILATPSMAWCTTESLRRNLEIWHQNIISAINSNFSNRVN